MDYTSSSYWVRGGDYLPRPRFIVFDLWNTLAKSYCPEPVLDFQKSLGYGAASLSSTHDEVDDEFLHACLTTQAMHPLHFVHMIGQRFGISIEPEHVEKFIDVIRVESGCVAIFRDAEKGLRGLQELGFDPEAQFGVGSNLWQFPAEVIFAEDALGKYFHPTHRVFSYEIGHRKPDPEFFAEICRRFGARPDEILMVGDNLEADVLGALNAGMQAALIDRQGTQKDACRTKAPEALYLRSLEELPTVLGRTS